MITNIPGLIERTTSELHKSADIAIVGMSGGADSTLVAILCKLAFGEKNVYGVHMPYNLHDAGTFNSRSTKTADKLGIHQFNVPVTAISDAISATIEATLTTKMTQVNSGNARSRARMCTLYALAHHLNDFFKKRVRVIGTGNLSEDFIGYDTKGGDALCDIFPIGRLFKSEVYQLLEYFVEQGVIDEEHIDRIPSAGLWGGQTDEEELGHTYNSQEPVIRKLLAEGLEIENPTELESFVINRHLANKHKHEAPPVLALREFCD